MLQLSMKVAEGVKHPGPTLQSSDASRQSFGDCEGNSEV